MPNPLLVRISAAWRRSRAHWWSAWLVDLAILLPLLWGVMTWQERHLLPTGGEEPAPGFELATLDGRAYRLGGASNRQTLVYFFAPWCVVCHASVENVEDLRRARTTDELDIVLVALDWTNVADVERFVSRHDLTVPVVLGTPEVRNAFRIDAYPTYYVLGKAGQVVARSRGYSTEIGMRLRARGQE